MIWQMIVSNILHRPLRTLISMLAVGVEVTLVIIIVGLPSGMLTETTKRIEGVGAEIEGGSHTLASLEKIALAAPDPVQRHSGRQELIENLFNEFI